MGTTQPAAAAPLVLEERAGAIATIRLNRPDKLNALNLQLAQDLVHALLRAQAARAVRSLELLRDARQPKAAAEIEALVTAGKEISIAIATMPKVVIASVNGPAAGGGMNLALAADIRIASDQARFAESFAQIGLFPDFGGTFFLPRIVGPARAAELFYTGQMLTAEEALRLGIVSRVVPADQLEAETKKLAEGIATGAGLAQRDVKHRMTEEHRKDLEAALDEEIRLQRHCFESHDCLEGLNAFFEKRKPNFAGH